MYLRNVRINFIIKHLSVLIFILMPNINKFIFLYLQIQTFPSPEKVVLINKNKMKKNERSNTRRQLLTLNFFQEG